MVKLSRPFHSFVIVCLTALFLTSCNKKDILYKRAYTDEEKMALSESLSNGAGFYYQGTVGDRMLIREGLSYNPDNSWCMREIGVPYLKRGFAAEANEYYSMAIDSDAEEWLGYKAYCWLYFYRDYQTALREIDRSDAFTPGIVDYPQSTSLNYMRGMCYLNLGRYQEAIQALNLHLNKEIEMVGQGYIDAMTYLSLGMGYQKNGQYEKADSIYSLGIEYNNSTSDLHYYKAENLLLMEEKKEAKKSFLLAQEWYSKGAKNTRPYVEEFFAIYQEDLDELDNRIASVD